MEKYIDCKDCKKQYYCEHTYMQGIYGRKIMKLKNHYVWICLLWIIATLCNSVSCVVNFVNENLGFGCLFLVLAVGFSFMSGVLFNKARAIYHHNQQVDWLHDIANQLREENANNIKPFEDFENNEPNK